MSICSRLKADVVVLRYVAILVSALQTMYSLVPFCFQGKDWRSCVRCLLAHLLNHGWSCFKQSHDTIIYYMISYISVMLLEHHHMDIWRNDETLLSPPPSQHSNLMQWTSNKNINPTPILPSFSPTSTAAPAQASKRLVATYPVMGIQCSINFGISLDTWE